MKTILLIIIILYSRFIFSQTELENDERPQIVTLIENDTLPGTYSNHLPFDGTFKQLSLFRHPNGTFDYVTVITGEYQNKKPIGVWEYARLDQDFYTVGLEKMIYYYPDSTVIKSYYGTIKYNSDSTFVTASINGMYSEVNISCERNLCIFHSEEKAGNIFYFDQEHLDILINHLKEGTPEIEIYLEFGRKTAPNTK